MRMVPAISSDKGGGRRAGVLVAAASLIIAAVCVFVVSLDSQGKTSELVQKQNGKTENIEELQKNVAKLTGLLNKASRQAQNAEEEEEVARSTLDQAKSSSDQELARAKGKHIVGDAGKIGESEHDLQKALKAASAKAQAAEARRKSLQSKLDAKVNALAAAQIQQHTHDSDEGGSYVESTHVIDHAATPMVHAAVATTAAKAASGSGGNAVVQGLRKKLEALTNSLKLLKDSEKQIAGLAGVGEGLLQMPKVQEAIKQSLTSDDYKIALEIAKSLNQTAPVGTIDPKIVAEVAIATSERNNKILPKADANLTAVEDAIMKEIEQAKNEIKIEGDVHRKTK